ncbi:hypothetical protein LTR91_012773 [Friedmanniomyces endolithicus]|uniref:Carbohydrate kinase PfkB domain-containing protein n=1 Tax=Friedmanniomyces endolithicus TaxID=329885 RepID=A0AAN6QQ82_9PEZI|nr:hypothetical protein LTR94_007877 [Friedmanniomyces endolithicus]KAK0800727.1 hypothetical protein LTR59_005632 [Friedmanniomyces endolithicus]KAK0849807.1 hypothetical protein LTR03_004993 [Friedmanniomyces endolithicus]KAK0864975.1 hypothetical protein LTS02_005618 [Friedmanniomyces endolithicus]KAK0895537.1 hypothetical protein LTR57_022987 [Friedmanniomyces endolithicus]
MARLKVSFTFDFPEEVEARTRLDNRPLTPHEEKTNAYIRFSQVSEEVQQAVAERRPVVALESTIYTHGLPYPDNLALASRLESLVRVNGGVPATIGILEGVARVGLGADELTRLVSSSGARKVSRRDLGFACGMTGIDGKGLNGGTTVSGTMILAHKAGIRIFATGGLGGVHRGAEQTMDVSADLTELGRTPVAVISSGCKSFLDIPKTLEYLETQGVAVATFADGRESNVDFPAFWSRDSGVRSPAVVRDEAEAARVIYAHVSLGLQSGLHFANPIPERYSIPHIQMETTIAQALREAETAGAIGAASTPYILAKIKDLTGSKSVEANKALVEANVIRGTKVAVALQKLEMDGSGEDNRSDRPESQVAGSGTNYTSNGVSLKASAPLSELSTEPDEVIPSSITSKSAASSTANSAPTVFVAGSLNVDLSCDFAPQSSSSSHSPQLHTSNPAAITQSLGGVAHNIARAAHLMGANVRLCSAVGDDLSGKAALEALSASGMSSAGIKVMPAESGSRTSQYVAINDTNKGLVLAMADVSILEDTKEDSAISDSLEHFWLPQLQQARPTHLVLDANWPPQHLSRWLRAGASTASHITFEPVSNSKSTSLFHPPKTHPLAVFPTPSLHLATPNASELSAMHLAAREAALFHRQDWWAVIDALGIPDTGARVQLSLATNSALVDQGVPQQSLQLLPFIPAICCKLGAEGVLLTQLLPAGDERLTSAAYAPFILSRCGNGSEGTLGVGGVYMRLFPAVEEVRGEEVVSVNGVGDTLAGALVAGLALGGKGARVEEFVDVAQRAAVLTLKSTESVSPGLGTLRMLV